jgi:hypothetical protein
VDTQPAAEVVAHDGNQDLVGLREQLDAERNNVELLQETISRLELAVEDVGWQRLVAQAEREFTREGLRQITAVCQLMALANPLVKRGLMLRSVYVWGQGVEISARANGKRGRDREQDVNSVIQRFLDDPSNRRAMFGAEAQQRLERALGTDGNLFLALWTRPASGRVQVRVLRWDEIIDVVRNPDDSSEPWFYHRRWWEMTVGPQAVEQPKKIREALYPALEYRPKSKPKTVGDIEVRWDAPVRHVKVNDLEGWRFGVPDAYAAVDWARAYKDFLEDWAKLVKALSKFAWRTTAKGQAQATKMGAQFAAINRRPDEVAGTAVMPEGVPLEAIPKTGATVDSESGRPLAMMVASALGVPVTMLLADPGQTGARAVAETLDQPTELEMESRRSLWTDVLRDITDHVVRESVRATGGPLKGKVRLDPDGVETVELAGDTEQTVDVVWPDLKDLQPREIIAAIVEAASTLTVPPEITLRLLLSAMGVKDVDEIVDRMVGDDGNFLWPHIPPISGPGGFDGPSGADIARSGGDPATAGGGTMGDGEDPGNGA